ncbi:hypothetical protein HMPREF0663_10724 [Hoylesella oralis ATCC 33269]|uniref:Uncharacterized protein n=1 Tax=Hoylesella oralis ATCC 33269 TaxID=873533 RepID=E7RLJ0_9BACT|nr:hypothetical protein HMPREF0663_10724 [Hoylesella oralis ATCC 33269]
MASVLHSKQKKDISLHKIGGIAAIRSRFHRSLRVLSAQNKIFTKNRK